ncbi:hypothetical protein F5Y14DRAFT_433498 [Nemania sp. NC0429]|nr:hypothetical protein F5Y14DRAFT_433498 [Nemania sp. NC0429]
MSQAIEAREKPKDGGRRRRKRREKVVLLEGDEEAPLPMPFRTDSLGSRDDEESREALVWLDTPGAEDCFQDTDREDGEWPSFAPPPGDGRRTRKMRPMTPAQWRHALRNSPMLLELFNYFGTPPPWTIPQPIPGMTQETMQGTTQETTQKTTQKSTQKPTQETKQKATQEITQETTRGAKKSMDKRINDETASISTSSTSTLSHLGFDDVDPEWDRMQGTPEDIEFMWSPPLPACGLPDKAGLLFGAARNRWRRTMLTLIEEKDDPKKWPKRSQFPAWKPKSTQQWLDSLRACTEAVAEKGRALLEEAARESMKTGPFTYDELQLLVATGRTSDKPAAAMSSILPSVITGAKEHSMASPGKSAQATTSQAAVPDEQAEDPMSASGHSQGFVIVDDEKLGGHPEGSEIQTCGEPDEAMLSGTTATASRASGMPEDQTVPEAVDHSGGHSSNEFQAEGQQAIAPQAPVHGGSQQTGWWARLRSRFGQSDAEPAQQQQQAPNRRRR